jgi:hypothetical protein
MRSKRPFPAALLALASLGGCTTHSHCTAWSGVLDIRGVPAEYQQTTSYAIHGLFVFPLLGDASIEKGVREFTAEASARNAKRINIEQTDKSYYWWVFPPISFFIQPVVMEVSGVVEGTSGPGAK